MFYFWWTLTLLIMLFGWAATLVPTLPGTTIILAGAVLHRLMLGAEHSVSWTTVIVLAVLTFVSYIVELVSGSVGGKWFGATKWGAIGGMIGAIVGLFFGIVGVFVAPLVGVLLGELLGGKELLPATKSTWGTFLGTTAGIVGKAVIGGVMVVWFLVAALWR
jgi:uncharacterized protein YqgC (DUF456 family)